MQLGMSLVRNDLFPRTHRGTSLNVNILFNYLKLCEVNWWNCKAFLARKNQRSCFVYQYEKGFENAQKINNENEQQPRETLKEWALVMDANFTLEFNQVSKFVHTLSHQISIGNEPRLRWIVVDE